MLVEKKHIRLLILLAILLPVAYIIHLLSGEIKVNFKDAVDSIFNFDSSNIQQYIFRNIRIPRVTTALLAGGALSISGLLMQTLFRNPLAGPYVLGLNSGASLFVGIAMLTGVSFFTSSFGIVVNAFLGALLFGFIILAFSKFVTNQLSLLLTGIMLGSFTSSFITIIQSASDAIDLKMFMLWGFGSLQKVTTSSLPYLVLFILGGLLLSLLLTKSLNTLVLGEHQAKLLGINVKRNRYLIIGITSILAGTVTAFCGPIAFVGLAVPNIIRLIFKTQHHGVLILASFLGGALFMITTDIIIQLIAPYFSIPINALTSIVGAPIVVLILFKKLK